MFEYEDRLPIFFCGKHVDDVAFRCVVELEYNYSWDEASYNISEIYIQDYNGDEFQPSGENFDMVERMIVELYDRKLQDLTDEKFEGSKDDSDYRYDERRDSGVYA